MFFRSNPVTCLDELVTYTSSNASINIVGPWKIDGFRASLQANLLIAIDPKISLTIQP